MNQMWTPPVLHLNLPHLLRVAALACFGLLSGCATLPLHSPDEELLDIRMGTGRIEPVLANTDFGSVVAGAVSSHPSLAMSSAQVRGAEAVLADARSAARPQISIGLDLGVSLLSSSTATRSLPMIKVSQLLFDGGATRARIEAAEGGFVSSALARETVAGQLAMTAVEVWYELGHQRELMRLATENLAAHRHFLEILEDRLAAGAGTQSDLLTAQSRVADARARQATIRGNLDRAEARYVEIFGTLPARFTPVAPAPKLPQGSDEELIATSPRLRGLDAEIANAKSLLDVRKAAIWPTLTIGLDTSYDPDTGDVSGAATATPFFDLADGGRRANAVAQAQSFLDELTADKLLLRREIARTLTYLRSDARAGQARLQAAADSVKANRAAVTGMGEQFTIGRTGLLQLVDAQRNLFEAQETLANAKRDLTLSGYAALALTGDILDAFGLYLPMPDRSPVTEEAATEPAEKVPPEEKVFLTIRDGADK